MVDYKSKSRKMKEKIENRIKLIENRRESKEKWIK